MSDAFPEDLNRYLFQWNTNIWDTWPEVEGQNFKEDWNKKSHINHSKRSETQATRGSCTNGSCHLSQLHNQGQKSNYGTANSTVSERP